MLPELPLVLPFTQWHIVGDLIEAVLDGDERSTEIFRIDSIVRLSETLFQVKLALYSNPEKWFETQVLHGERIEFCAGAFSDETSIAPSACRSKVSVTRELVRLGPRSSAADSRAKYEACMDPRVSELVHGAKSGIKTRAKYYKQT
jgi:hypothetical protein